MYKQLESIKKMGPLKQVMGMIPMGGLDMPDDALDVTSVKMERYKIVMDSMTDEELENPTLINSSRTNRIALGAGAKPEEVRELIKYYKTMQKTMKAMRGGMGGGKFNMQRMMKKFGGM
jgi:signal recognition particle subunit SRP54